MSSSSWLGSSPSSSSLSVCIFTLDYYLSSPLSELDVRFSGQRNFAVKQLPVIRIFGTEVTTGTKTCLHIHNAFPYLYVPLANLEEKEWQRFAFELANNLDRALNMSTLHNRHQRVYKWEICSKYPVYGYHPKLAKFIKIYFYRPADVKKAADLLLNGSVIKQQRLQPHESHVPFTLQFMMDHNLQGMGVIHVSRVRHRRPSESDQDDGSSQSNKKDEMDPAVAFFAPCQETQGLKAVLNAKSTDMFLDDHSVYDDEELFLPPEITKMSTCALECDAVVDDIINEGDSDENPGLKFVWEDERLRREQLNMDEELEAPASPPRNFDDQVESQRFWQQRLKERIAKLEAQEAQASNESGHATNEPGQASWDPDCTANFEPTQLLMRANQRDQGEPLEACDDEREATHCQSNSSDSSDFIPDTPEREKKTRTTMKTSDKGQTFQRSMNTSEDVFNEVDDEELVRLVESLDKNLIKDDNDLGDDNEMKREEEEEEDEANETLEMSQMVDWALDNDDELLVHLSETLNTKK